MTESAENSGVSLFGEEETNEETNQERNEEEEENQEEEDVYDFPPAVLPTKEVLNANSLCLPQRRQQNISTKNSKES